MTQEPELTEPNVADVPEPDQPLDEPGPSDDEATEEEEAHEAETHDNEPGQASAPPVDAAKEQRRIAAALKREKEAHDKKLEKILGEAHEHVLACPLCADGLQGYVFPGDGQMLGEEEKAQVLAFLGVEGAEEMPQTPDTHECERCHGFGETKNPTKAAHYLTSQCAPCGGQGYIKSQAAPPALVQVPHTTAANVTASNGVVGPCPLCNAPNSAGKPHFCNPVPQGAGV